MKNLITYKPVNTSNSRFRDLQGRRFARLTAAKLLGRHKNATYWLCLCDCGNETAVASTSLLGGNTRSCGCYMRERIRESSATHGKSVTPEYNIWQHIKKRCNNPSDKAYKHYGERGIKVCNRWLESFENFLEDMGKRPNGNYSLDRIDNDGPYSPDNCRWATASEQANNTRACRYLEYQGKVQTIAQWSRETGIGYTTLINRINKGVLPKVALAK